MLREDRAAEAGTYAAAAARLPGKKKNCKKLIYFGKECTGFMKYGKRLTACTLAGLLGISVFSQPLTLLLYEHTVAAVFLIWGSSQTQNICAASQHAWR